MKKHTRNSGPTALFTSATKLEQTVTAYEELVFI
jgi:hypothetical protein